jgi:hypothetical protein
MNVFIMFFRNVARWFSISARRRRLLLGDEEYEKWLGI